MTSLESQVQQLKKEIAALSRELADEKQAHPQAAPDVDQSIHLCSPLILQKMLTFNAFTHYALDSIETPPESDIGQRNSEVFHDQRSTCDLSGLAFSKMLKPTFNSFNDTNKDGAGFTSAIWRLCQEDILSSDLIAVQSNTTQEGCLPTAQLGESLIDMFFQQRWPGLPFLHKPTFLDKCYYPVMRGDDANHSSAVMTYLVFAIAAADLRRLDPDSPWSSSLYFRIAVEKYLNGLLVADDISCIQGLLLLSIYGLIEPQSVNVWYTTGMALRMATDLGMNRSIVPTDWSLLGSEMRKRVFWCVYVMERSVCFALGRPMSIRNVDIDVELPIALTDDELLSESQSILIQQRLIPDPLDTSSFIHIIQLRQINVTIQETFFPVQKSTFPHSYFEDVRGQLRTQLDQWMATAPRYKLTVSTFQSMEWLEAAYHYALISFHRPTPACPQVSVESLQISADSSISIIGLIGSLCAKNKITYAFVSLYTLFSASITMLYTLQASSTIRQGTTKAVVQGNINSCMTLFEGLSQGRSSGQRCSNIVARLGQATLDLFDKRSTHFGDVQNSVDPLQNISETHPDLWSWFGLKYPAAPASFQDHTASHNVDLASLGDPWNTFFDQIFDV